MQNISALQENNESFSSGKVEMTQAVVMKLVGNIRD